LTGHRGRNVRYIKAAHFRTLSVAWYKILREANVKVKGH